MSMGCNEQESGDTATNMLMQSLGNLMLHWSTLERALLDDIKRLRLVDGESGEPTRRGRGSFSQRLAEWRALLSLKSRRNPAAAQEAGEIATQAERLRRTHDLIAHHLVGAEKSASGEHQILVSESGISALPRSQTAYTTSQLRGLVSEMREAVSRIEHLKDVVAK